MACKRRGEEIEAELKERYEAIEQKLSKAEVEAEIAAERPSWRRKGSGDDGGG